jgi:hypothetical protein
MSLITLELKNDADLELFISFARRLNAAIVDISKPSLSNAENPVEWLEKIAAIGCVRSISNPSDWQREIRKDNKLPNRD